MFSKSNENSKDEYDPASKIRKGNFNKVNKRRTTNAVTRSNNSKSVTFKSNGSLDHSEKLFSILNKNKDSFKNWDLMEYLLAPYYSESKD